MTDLARWWPLPDRQELRRDLEAAYADPSRGYHDTLHLTEVLERLDELAASVPYAREPVLLAAWFHDSVYDGVPGDEERSAAWARSALEAHPNVDEVVRLVLMTERHRPVDGDVNGSALSDADLAILAAPSERYDAYVAAVRREYAEIPEADFIAGRSAILGDLLAKSSLFHTGYAKERWEPAARANVSAELSAMRGPRP